MGTSFGRGGATDYQQDLMNSDCITIMGSNMAENHPVGFQWVLEARERGAEVVHIDPRFTRTSAMSTKYIGIRAGSDIAFLGGVVNYILENDRWFHEYVRTYTNARVIIDDAYVDTEEADGLFSGWDPEQGKYDATTWQYKGMQVHGSGGSPEEGVKGEQSHGSHGGLLSHGDPPEEDWDLEHPRCVFQILKRHYARYTPEFVAETCGCTVEEFLWYADTICKNSGRERTGAFAYAVGWTQHTTGVQLIRSAAIIQLLLGNMGRPGCGIMALRGHASIQGSTDIPTLYNILPGYLVMPHTEHYGGLQKYIERSTAPAGWWGNADAYIVSLLKAWWGPAATKENEFCFSWLPRIDDDNSHYWTVQQMLKGKVKGYIVAGENPAVGSANGRAQRLGLAQLDWLVVRDLVEIETASFWYDSPEIESGELRTEQIPTEVFLMPASTHLEKDGSFTNTQRLLQWHFKAVEPKEDCRSELWFYYHLGKKIKEKLKESQDPKDWPVQHLTWEYGEQGENEEPSASDVLREINGYDDHGQLLAAYKLLKADGSTSCGCWIYCGAFADGKNMTARKTPHWEQTYTALEWAWSWPANRRLLYNRASADPDGKPWSDRKELVWWDAEQKKWTGHDTPDFDEEKPPDYVPPDDAKGPDAIAGNHPFIMQADGLGWLYVPQGLEDGPLPTHYEPHESPFDNPLYSQRANPRRQQNKDLEEDPYNPVAGEGGSELFPYVVTTYRLTEHHTAGGMTRFTPYLSELQPQMFVEVHPDLARERGLEHGGWATIVTMRSAIEARVLVTDRMRPMKVNGAVRHQVGLPYHWGQRGLVTGGAANDLAHMALDPNVHIQEVKAFTCDIRPGRRPRGPKLAQFMDELRAEARAARATATRHEPEETRKT
ncbi:MAG: molybdopterin-dependent oxidoreductase [Actinobacteria bacterium]|nr:molybdopterin-dependent oxidoreductase [Actinomycetota bacterium]